MTVEEKAEELIGRFKLSGQLFIGLNNKQSKQCALIAIDEIEKNHEQLGNEMFEKIGTDSYVERCLNYDLQNYWKEVRREIEKA